MQIGIVLADSAFQGFFLPCDRIAPYGGAAHHLSVGPQRIALDLKLESKTFARRGRGRRLP
jgi:hypothetical protein